MVPTLGACFLSHPIKRALAIDPDNPIKNVAEAILPDKRPPIKLFPKAIIAHDKTP